MYLRNCQGLEHNGMEKGVAYEKGKYEKNYGNIRNIDDL